MSILELRDVHRTFAGRPPVHALRGVSFSVDEGEVVGLLGVNGAGKTTIVKIVSTLLLPTRGTAMVAGLDVIRRPRQVRARLGVVFGGDRGLYTRLSALDNLVFFGGLAGIRRGLRRRSMAALERVGLAERAHGRVETFSRGMRQRLHLAAGMLHEPLVLLLDEPTVGLDTVEAQRVRETVAELARSGTTVLLTSHYPVDIDRLAQRVVVLRDGVIGHDLPIARFRELAGFVAEVRVRGTGRPPDPPALTDAADGVEITDDAGTGWRLTCRLREWNGEALRRVTEVASASGVVDVSVAPVELEYVLRSLFDQPNPAGGRGGA